MYIDSTEGRKTKSFFFDQNEKQNLQCTNF